MDAPRIIAATCAVTGLEAKGRLASSDRDPLVVLARRSIVHLCRAHTELSYPEIAAAMGKERNLHTTALSLHGQMKREMRRRPRPLGDRFPKPLATLTLLEVVIRIETRLGV